MSSDEQPEAAAEERDTPAGKPGAPRWLLLGSAAAAVAAFLVMAIFGAMWAFAGGGDSEVAVARDDVAKAAGNAAVAYTELDYKQPDQYFSRVRSLAEGQFLQSINQAEKDLRGALKTAKTQVASQLLDVGVIELNEHEGSASALAVVQGKVTQGKNEMTKVFQLEFKMTRVEADGEQVWKVSGIGGDAQAANPGK